jgi:predicted glutamine amidotransferase
MCGIAGVHFFNSKKTSFKTWEKEMLVNELLLGIEHRGTDATGIATIRGNGDIWIEKAELEAKEFVKHRTSLDKRVKTILLHTRYATKGHQSNNLNNHPVVNDNAVITHNGHIRNDDDVFKENSDLNRTAEVDSEAIAALFNKYGVEKAHLALQELEGGFAIAAIDQRIPTALVLAKGKTSPLTYYKNNDFIVWASESRVIEIAFDKVNSSLGVKFGDVDYLKEGEILYMDHGKMENLEFKVKETPFVFKSHNYTGTTPANNYRKKHFWNDWDKEDEDDNKILVPKSVIPRHGSFEIRVDGRKITYRCCFKCGIAANEDFLKGFDGGFWCDVCLDNELEWYTISGDPIKTAEMEEEDKIMEEFEKYGLKAAQESDHMDICERIAVLAGLSKGFVDYMLFECEELMDGEILNPEINELYDKLAALYDAEVGIIFGDEEEKTESQEALKTEIVKFKKQSVIGL